MCVCLCALGGVAHFAVLLLVPHRDPSGDKITDRQNGPTPSSKLHASPVKISSRHPAGLPSYLYKYLGNPGSSRAPSSNHFILLLLSSSVPSGDFALRRSHVALPDPLVGLLPHGHCLLDSAGFRCRREDVRSGLFTFPGDVLLSFLPPEGHHA